MVKPSSKSHRRLANIRDFLDSSDNEDLSSSSSKKPDHHHQKERKKVLSESKPSFDSETKSPVAEKSHKERYSDGEKVFVEKQHREKEPSTDPVEKVKLKKKKHDDDRRHHDSFEGSSEKKKKKKHKKEKHGNLDRSLDDSFKHKEFIEKAKHEFKDREKHTKPHKLDDTKKDVKEKEDKKEKDDKKLNVPTASPIKTSSKEKHKIEHSKQASSKLKSFHNIPFKFLVSTMFSTCFVLKQLDIQLKRTLDIFNF